ncbi:MAG TPA: thioredoxin domain-containing protein [Desulfuromonadales bacterium]|nr:thioredoxin domain-containing protein [Desulfuromonadales bacterium]
MGIRYRLFVLILLSIGLALSILSATDLCNFGGCSETHQYRLLGLPFPAVGVTFFTLAGLLTLLTTRFSVAEFLLNLLLAGAGGAEVNMILLQKNVIKAWCPVCLAIAALIYLLLLTNLVRYLLTRKEKFCMKPKFVYQPLLIVVVALFSFIVTFSGIAKPDAVAGQLNLSLGNQQSNVEIYLFSDWLCPVCVKVEAVIEPLYPTLSNKAKLFFVDKIIHPEATNFVPYHLSFAAYEKDKYPQLRKALFAVGQKTKNPTNEDIMAAIAPQKIAYKQLSFLDVTQQMGNSIKLAEQFRVTSTPTMIIRNSKTGKIRALVGSGEITSALILKSIKDVE